MVGHAERVVIVEADDLSGRLELFVVVEDNRLVSVDVPLGHIRHLRPHRRAGHGVVEIAPLAVEDVGVRLGQRGRQIDVASVDEDVDRVFLGVAVQVAHEQDVGVTLVDGRFSEPVDHDLGRRRARAVAAAA